MASYGHCASSSSSSSCGTVAAVYRPQLDTINDFTMKVLSFWDDPSHNFPQFTEDKEKWEIALMKPDGIFKHHSILVESPSTGERFKLELRKMTVTDKDNETERYYVIPDCCYIDTDKFRKHEKLPLGTTKEMTGIKLIVIALECIQELGKYNIFSNNCQHYCQKLATKLGCVALLPDMDIIEDLAMGTLYMMIPGSQIVGVASMMTTITQIYLRYKLAKPVHVN